MDISVRELVSDFSLGSTPPRSEVAFGGGGRLILLVEGADDSEDSASSANGL